MSIQNYVFIDGNYLRRAYEDSMRQFFSDVDPAHLSLLRVKEAAGASKGFYYDSVDEDDAPKAAQQRTRLDAIRELPGFHVRQGTISARKRQKQVDVQLAVDMLTHAFNKNIWHASLIAGDLDFKPLVDSLVNFGVHVHLFYERRSASKSLVHAADVAVPITLDMFWDWSTASYQRSHPRPVAVLNEDTHPPGIHTLDYQGTWNGRVIYMYGINNRTSWCLHLPRHEDLPSLSIRHPDNTELLKYFGLNHPGVVEWTDRPA